MRAEKTVRLNANAADVWTAFNDWGGVWRFQPWVVRSPLLSKNNEGVGAKTVDIRSKSSSSEFSPVPKSPSLSPFYPRLVAFRSLACRRDVRTARSSDV